MRITIGRPRGMLSSAGGFPRADPASAIISRMIPPPDAAHEAAIRSLVTSLVDNDIWEKMDAFYMFAAHSDQAASLNWIGPNYTIVQNGTGITFHTDEGFFIPNSFGHLETGLAPSAAVKFQLNSASFGFWNRYGPPNSTRDAGTQISDGTSITCQSPGTGNAALKINSSGVIMNMPVDTATGSFAIGLQTNVHRCEWLSMDGAATQSGIATGTPTALALDQFRFGGLSAAPRQFACGWIGGGMSLIDLANISGAIRFYLLAIGSADGFVPSDEGGYLATVYFGTMYFPPRYFG